MNEDPALVEERNAGDDLVLFTGPPVGAAGVLTLEMGSDVLLVFDAADPRSLVEVAVRRPVTEAAKEELAVVVGSRAAAELLEGALERITPMRSVETQALGRLALLSWVEQIWPMATAECLWDLERIPLCRRIGTPSMLERAALAARNLRAHGAGHFEHVPEVVRLFEPGVTDADYEFAVLAVRRELLERHPSPPPGRIDAQLTFPVAWDAVPRGSVDLSEDAIRVAPNGTSVAVAAQQASTKPLFLHLIGVEARPDAFMELRRRGHRYEAELPAPVGSSILEITDDRSRPITSEADRQVARRRREAFRALAAERRATSLASVDTGRAQRTWSVAAEHWTHVQELAVGEPSDVLVGRIAAARKLARSAGPDGVAPAGMEAFLAELASDPAAFDSLERPHRYR